MDRILIVDDEKNVTSSFKKILSQEGYEVLTANDAQEGLLIAKNTPVDLAIMDIRMPGMNGLDAFSKFKEIDSKMPVIIMTAFGTTETAIEAMRLGAHDYVIKPFDVPVIKQMIEKALTVARLMRVSVAYDAKKEFKGDRIAGSSPKMQKIYKLVGQVAASDVTVLLRGESGTGKELFARAIYHHSPRKDKPFLVMNSAAIPESLLESELFGYEKGAFTDARERRIGKLEQCDGGTLFLDEIGDMPMTTQAKVLRVLQDCSFERLGANKTIRADVRFITATNKDLESLMKEGKFREDLYYRLNVVSIQIPSLRERKEDIPEMVEYFLAKYGKEFHKEGLQIPSEALRKFQEYDWPGNVRELENTIKKAIILGKGSVLLPEHGGVFVKTPLTGGSDLRTQLQDLLERMIRQGLSGNKDSLYADVITEVERTLIQETLRQANGNQTQTARLLGISRPTLKEKIEKLGIKKEIHISNL